MIRSLLTGALLALSVTVSAAGLEDLAARLSESTAVLSQNGRGVCTAAKIGPRTYLTARHCVDLQLPPEKSKVRIEHGVNYFWPRSILTAAQKGEDWAIVNVTETSDIPALEVDCDYEPRVGEEMAYVGNPLIWESVFYTSRISTTQPLGRGYADRVSSDFWLNSGGAPGSSGSSLVSVKTGKIVGVVVEGAPKANLMGADSVSGLDMCELADEGIPEEETDQPAAGTESLGKPLRAPIDWT